MCRAALGVCDNPEYCTGNDAACPADKPRPKGDLCRSATGFCDVPEYCDGAGVQCPADMKKPDNTTCSTICFEEFPGVCRNGVCTCEVPN
jgi:hypothetical protein